MPKGTRITMYTVDQLDDLEAFQPMRTVLPRWSRTMSLCRRRRTKMRLRRLGMVILRKKDRGGAAAGLKTGEGGAGWPIRLPRGSDRRGEKRRFLERVANSGAKPFAAPSD